MWDTYISLAAVLTVVRGTIIVYTQFTPHSIMEDYRDMPADFGPEIPPDGLRGFLVQGIPTDGCTNMTKPPVVTENFTGRWFVLVTKNLSACSYETQVRNAQEAGFDMAIVHNVNSSDLEVMTADDSNDIVIQSVFVSAKAGLDLSALYQYDEGYYIMVNTELPFNINTHLLLPFAIVVVLCLLIILIFMIVKCIKDRRRARRHRLPNRALDKIPTCKFSKGDPYETCAICLDDYQEGERLRVLPCAHAYHTVCIDPWLTQNKRVCPVCKRRVFAAGERRRVDSSSSDDTAPLLPNAPVTQGGTFDEQRENPFARATRFMARLRARHERGDNISEASASPPNDNAPINSNNDENGNTDEAAPLVPQVATLSERRTRRQDRRARQQHSINAAAGDTGSVSIRAGGLSQQTIRMIREHNRRIARDVHARQQAATNNDRGEIGVAALPAPQPNPRNASL